MIIFGTRGREEQLDTGSFPCPRCRDERGYRLKRVRRWFTLYFIPVFPVDSGTEFVECDLCRTTFTTEVFQAALPAPSGPALDGELKRALARSMAAVIVRTGSGGAPSQVSAASRVFKAATGHALPEDAFRKEIVGIQSGSLDVPEYLAGIAGSYPVEARERVMREVLQFAQSIGVTTSTGDATIGALAVALELTPEQTTGAA